MEDLVNHYIERVENAIDIANDVKENPYLLRTKLRDLILEMRGLSTKEVRIFLNELVDSNSKYLEIGLHRGSTFIPALFRNYPKYAVGIDDFGGALYDDSVQSSFLRYAEDFNIIEQSIYAPNVHSNPCLFHLIREDCFKLKDEHKNILSKEKFDIYFYDARHTFDDHVKSIVNYYEYLNDLFVLIVDDWSHPPAVDGTKVGIEKCGLKIKKEWKLGHSQYIKNSEELSWHNGLYVAILEK